MANAPQQPTSEERTPEGGCSRAVLRWANRPETPPEADSIDALIDRFERLWAEGQRPVLDSFLAAAGDHRRWLLVELVHVELELRLKAGEAARAEEYLGRFPELAGHPTLEWELIVAEHTQRARREPGLALEEYLRRFPHRRTELAQWQPAPSGEANSPATVQTEPTPAFPPSALPAVPGYEILGELGRGGMGAVYKAWQPSLKRVVALKLIRAGAGPEERNRFRTEAEAVARLRHPGIVQIHEVGEAAGLPYLTLEYVEGGSLSKRLDGAPWFSRKAAALVRALAEAIDHAHQQGVVHRDLKPGNVLLGPEERPLIGDFGLAKLLSADSDRCTRTGAVLGTPCYMSPEQASGLTREIGPATDVYALGAILYELLTGRPPFRGESVEQTVQLVRSAEPVAPRRLQPRVGRDLEIICLKCLRKKPVERYASAADLADDLRRHLDGEPVRARPPSVWRRGAAWARRRPVAAVLLLAAVLFVAAAVAGLSWHTAQLNIALEQTQQARRQADDNERRARQSDYAAQMRLAQKSLSLGDATVLPHLLDRFRPAFPAAEDLRGFEWWYLATHRQPTPRAIRAHKQDLYWLAYSPDGRLLATAGFSPHEEGVKVWDARTEELRFRVPLRQINGGRGPPAAFGRGDSRWLAACDGDAVTRWDLRTGKPLPDRMTVGNEVWGVTAHPDGRRLLVGGPAWVSVWDAHKGTCLARFPDSSIGVEQLCLLGNGSVLATVHGDGSLRLSDVATGELCGQGDSPSGSGALVGFPRSAVVGRLSKTHPRFLTDCGRQEVFWNWGERVSAPVTAAAVSPDEKLLATGHQDGMVRFWDVPTRAYRGQLRWQPAAVSALAFSPDGRSLAAGTRDGLVYQVSPPARQEADRLHADFQACGDVAFSPDGKSLAVPCLDRTVKLIDTGSGKARTILTGLVNPLTALAFASDGRTLATREWGANVVRLWDPATGQVKASVQGGRDCFTFAPTGSMLALGHEGIALTDDTGAARGAVRRAGAVTVSLAFSADGRTLATTDNGSIVELWDVSSGNLPSAPTHRQRLDRPIRSLAFLRDGILATAEESGTVRFWQTAGNKLSSVWSPLACSEPVTRLTVSPDGKTLLTHGPTHAVRSWDVFAGKFREPRQQYLSPGAQVAFAPEANGRASLSGEGMVELWDCKTWTVRLPPGQPVWPVSSLAFTADGQTLVTAGRLPDRIRREALFGGFSHTRALQGAAAGLRFWDPATGAERSGLDGPLTMAPPALVALAPDGHTLAAGAVDGSVWLWDRRKGGPPFRRLFVSALAENYALKRIEPLRARNLGSPDYASKSEMVRSVAFSPDGQQLAAAGSKGTVTVWESGGAWREVRSVSVDPAGPIWVAFSPSGDLVVPQGGQLHFLDRGEARRILGKTEDSPAVCVAFLARGNRLAVAHRDRRIRLWDLATKEFVGELIGHLDQVSALAFAPDGKTLASASHDRTVRLWSVAGVAEVASLEQHRGKVFCLAFSPDGTTLASGGEGPAGQGEVYLWRAPRTLRKDEG